MGEGSEKELKEKLRQLNIEKEKRVLALIQELLQEHGCELSVYPEVTINGKPQVIGVKAK